MSYGFVTSPSASEEEAIDYAVSQGIAIICSAGNESTSEPHYPSSYDLDNIISVAATDHNDARSSFSNYGAVSVDLAAPGQSILSTLFGGGYTPQSGDSLMI